MRNLALQRGIGGVLVFLLIWELAIRSGWLRVEYLPAPLAIATAFAGLLTTAAVYHETLHTVGAALISWTIAAAIGILFGAALGLFPALRTFTLTTVEVLRPLPPVALVPVGLLLFGFSIKTELFVIAIPCIWPILVGTMGGVMAVPAKLKEAARSLRLGSRDVLFKVLIPAAAPSVLVGCRLSMSIALVLAIVVEMIGNPEGLGYAVVREAQALNREAMFAYVFLIGLLGIAFNQVLVALSRLLLPGEFKRPLRVMGA